MADQPDKTPNENQTPKSDADRLLAVFNSLKSHDEKCRFFHDNPAIHSLIHGVFFPKPENQKLK